MNGKVIVGAACFVIGGAVGYFVGGKTCADHYRNTIRELQEELEEAEKKREPDISKEEIDGKVKEIREKYKPSEEDKEEYVEKVNKYSSVPVNVSDVEDDPFDPDDIYLISDDEFRKDLNYRDSETVTYYQEDHMLVDSADMPIHDEERVVGTEALDELPETEEDYLYVSNDIENKMYEIIVEHNQSFYRDVLGMEV